MQSARALLRSILVSSLASTLAFSLAFLVPAPNAHAGVVSTGDLIEAAAAPDTDADRERLHRLVDRADVAQQLAAVGVSSQEAHRRIAALSNAEVASLNGQIDQLPAGEGAIGILVGAILLVFFVLLITDLVGATDVFPFVNKHPRR